MLSWYLVYCKPKQEARAEENLVRQGFDVFLPTINVVKKRVGRKDIVREEPLFHRYIFLKVNPTITSIAPVISTFGISNFVKFGDKYATLPESLIEEIREYTEQAQGNLNNAYVFKPGDRVFVDGHGFNHVRAIYCNPCGSTRAMILVNFLGGKSKFHVPIEGLTKATDDTIGF